MCSFIIIHTRYTKTVVYFESVHTTALNEPPMTNELLPPQLLLEHANSASYFQPYSVYLMNKPTKKKKWRKDNFSLFSFRCTPTHPPVQS